MQLSSKILISGAGIAGLGAALRLSRAGFKPIIVEKAKNIRAGGYLVALSHQAYRFADEMDLIKDLKPYDLSINSSSYHNRRGVSLLDLDYAQMLQGLDIIQIMRDDLAKALYNKVKDHTDIRFNDHITAIDQQKNKANVEFYSGKKEEFDIVIGCDGAHSAVRKLCFNDHEYQHHYLDLHCAAFRLPNVINIQSKFATHMERSRYMAVFNTQEDDIGAVFVWSDKSQTLPPANQRRNHLINAFDNGSPTIQQILQHCPDEGPSYIDVLSQIDMPTWHKGNAILVGDAAHCLTLFSGRGAAAAFAGACRLSDAITAKSTAREAFTTYEKAMRPVINDIMPATRAAVKWYVPMTFANHFIRDNMMRLVPNIVFRKYFQRKYSKV